MKQNLTNVSDSTVKLSTIGSRAYVVVGPQIRNELLKDVPSAASLYTRLRRLETHLSMKSSPSHVIDNN